MDSIAVLLEKMVAKDVQRIDLINGQPMRIYMKNGATGTGAAFSSHQIITMLKDIAPADFINNVTQNKNSEFTFHLFHLSFHVRASSEINEFKASIDFSRNDIAADPEHISLSTRELFALKKRSENLAPHPNTHMQAIGGNTNVQAKSLSSHKRIPSIKTVLILLIAIVSCLVLSGVFFGVRHIKNQQIANDLRQYHQKTTKILADRTKGDNYMTLPTSKFYREAISIQESVISGLKSIYPSTKPIRELHQKLIRIEEKRLNLYQKTQQPGADSFDIVFGELEFVKLESTYWSHERDEIARNCGADDIAELPLEIP